MVCDIHTVGYYITVILIGSKNYNNNKTQSKNKYKSISTQFNIVGIGTRKIMRKTVWGFTKYFLLLYYVRLDYNSNAHR